MKPLPPVGAPSPFASSLARVAALMLLSALVGCRPPTPADQAASTATEDVSSAVTPSEPGIEGTASGYPPASTDPLRGQDIRSTLRFPILLGWPDFAPRRRASATPVPPTASPSPIPASPTPFPPNSARSGEGYPQALPQGAGFGPLPRPVGFGAAATGGGDGPVYVVRTLADSGVGSLREALETPGPMRVVFERSGIIRLRSPIQVRSDKTVDGRGRRIEITGHGFEINRASNIILSHLVIRDGKRDAVTVHWGSRHVWLNHLSLARFEDGLIDITRGATDVTVSHCRLEEQVKGMLIGASPQHRDDVVIRVTIHHSYFRSVTARNPKLRFGRVHHFNNVIEDWKGPAIEIAYGGQLRIEGTAFLPDPKKSKLAVQVQADAPGSVWAADLLNNGQPVQLNLPEQVFRPEYPYPLEPAGTAMVERVRAGAGWQAFGSVPAER